MIYFQGVDVGLNDNVDDTKKFLLIKSAAYGGYDQCQMLVGLMYSEGVFVDKCLNFSFDWFMKAALQGNAHAQFEIGTKYNEGKGVKQNFNKAYKWFLKAAEQGHTEAEQMMVLLTKV
jgi:TPR repeat protein